MFKTSMNILSESGSSGRDAGTVRESWAGEALGDDLIDGPSKRVMGETEKLEGWKISE